MTRCESYPPCCGTIYFPTAPKKLIVNQFILYDFLRLCFQRVHQPHPAQGARAFSSSVMPAASIIRGSMASIRSCAARSISNRCGYSFSLISSWL